MSTFTVQAFIANPEHPQRRLAIERERSVTTEFLVDTGAIYSLLPAEIVQRLGLEVEEDFQEILASGKPRLSGL